MKARHTRSLVICAMTAISTSEDPAGQQLTVTLVIASHTVKGLTLFQLADLHCSERLFHNYASSSIIPSHQGKGKPSQHAIPSLAGWNLAPLGRFCPSQCCQSEGIQVCTHPPASLHTSEIHQAAAKQLSALLRAALELEDFVRHSCSQRRLAHAWGAPDKGSLQADKSCHNSSHRGISAHKPAHGRGYELALLARQADSLNVRVSGPARQAAVTGVPTSTCTCISRCRWSLGLTLLHIGPHTSSSAGTALITLHLAFIQTSLLSFPSVMALFFCGSCSASRQRLLSIW